MAWIDIDDVKAHLNKSLTSTRDDAELGRFIPAACGIIEDLKGHVDVATFSDVFPASRVWGRHLHQRYAHWTYLVELPETPLFSVDDVQWLTAAGSSPVTPASFGVPGWWPVDTVLTVPQAGLYEVTYRAGRNPVPDNYILAALELTAHLWNGSQLNQNQGSNTRRASGDQMQVVPHIASALPYRVRELLGIYGNVVSDHVVIA